MADKYTAREFYTSVIEKLGAESVEGAYAQAQIAKLDAKLADRKGKLTEAQKETAALAEQIFASFEAGVVYTASQVGADFDISTQKASAILRKGVEAGTLVQSEVKIKTCKAEGIKGGKVKGYALAESAEIEGVGEVEGEG
jgi:hypothetical protein